MLLNIHHRIDIGLYGQLEKSNGDSMLVDFPVLNMLS